MKPVITAIALAIACVGASAQDIPTAPEVFVSPATGVVINQLVTVPFAPPLFGPVLRVTTAEGYTRMSIQGDGSIRFEHGATLSFDDLVEGDDGRVFVPVWVKGNLLLLEVHAPSKGHTLK